MADNEFEDVELINGFREESLEHIEVVESKLLDMESEGVNAEDVNTIFRSIHTIKGGSGFLGFESIKELSHYMESLLDLIRNGKSEMTTDVSDILLRGTDLLKAMLNDLANQELIVYDEELEILKRIISGEGGKAKVAAPVEEAAPVAALSGGKLLVSPDELNSYLNKGYNVYRLPYVKNSHLDKMRKKNYKTIRDYLNSFGGLIWEDGNLDGEAAQAVIVFATVLDADFASASLKVADSDLVKLSKEETLRLLVTVNHAPAAPVAKPAPVPAAPQAVAPKVEAAKPAAVPKPAAAAKPMKASKSADHDEHDEEERANKKAGAAAASAASATVRVSTVLLNKLMNLAGELILCRNQLVQKLDSKDISELQSLNQRLTELQESVMQTRLQQVGAVYSKVPRMVRDLSKTLNKRVNVELEGNEVELDRTIVDAITDPLTHLVRNSIDHGIERPEERIANGKNPTGTLTLRAYHEGGQVNLEIKDDGKGIDAEVLKRKAVEKGVCTPAEVAVMGQREALNIIFRPGFSTAAEITEVSGRGVGMDVVKTTFEKLGGTIDIHSEVNKGTSILVKLPTTLAIVSAVIIDVETFDFAIPQTNIEEIVRIKENEMAQKLERVGKYEIFRLRGRLLPVLRLADVLQIKRHYIDQDGRRYEDRRDTLADRRDPKLPVTPEILMRRSGDDRRNQGRTMYIVVLRIGQNRYGMLVNKIRDVEEVVVKPTSAFLKEIKCFHGTTILGDGRVIMILDCNGIAATAKLKFDALRDMSEQDSFHGHGHRQETQSFLIFNNHPDENFAIPLSFITRIEKVEAKNIERLGEDEYIQVGGKNVPLFRLEAKINCKPGKPDEEGTLYLLIPNLVRSPYALVATKVQDVVSASVEVQPDVMKREGVLGNSIIKGKMTMVLDIYGLFGERRESGLLIGSKRHRILLAEDTPFFRAMIRKYLEEHGLEVDDAVHGQEAWEMLEHNKNYDLVLSDIEMPVMNGYELVTKIKSHLEYCRIPVMAITALDNPQALMQGKQAGFDAYQVKLDRTELIKTIDNLLAYAAHHP